MYETSINGESTPCVEEIEKYRDEILENDS